MGYTAVLCLSTLILLNALQLVSSQEAPALGILTNFDERVFHRTNVCNRQKMIVDDEIELRDALRGLELNCFITDYSGTPMKDLFALTEEGTVPETGLGLMAKMLDELADRAGFTWRNSFAAGKPLSVEVDGNKTYTDLQGWATDRFDVAVDYWGESNERKARGISYVEHFYDLDIILVTKTGKSVPRLWNLFRPFHVAVWLMIGIATFATGFLYTVLEGLDDNTDDRKLGGKPLAASFLAAITFTGHFEFRPDSYAAMLLSFSWSFWALITASAYTANLASFLVSRDKQSTTISTMEGVIRNGKTVCVFEKTVAEDFFINNYPIFAKDPSKLIRKSDEGEVIDGLHNDECDFAATGSSFFKKSVMDSTYNSDCTLTKVGLTLQVTPAGFATSVDTGTYCTSLISYALDLHMNEMKTSIDGKTPKFDNIRDDHRNANIAVKSQCEDYQEVKEDFSLALGLDDMGGIFLLHLICCAVALLLATFQYFSARRKQKLRNDDTMVKQSIRKSIWVSSTNLDQHARAPENHQARLSTSMQRMNKLGSGNQAMSTTIWKSSRKAGNSQSVPIQPNPLRSRKRVKFDEKVLANDLSLSRGESISEKDYSSESDNGSLLSFRA